MTRRMKFRLTLIFGLLLGSSVVGQPPLDESPAGPRVDPEIQQAQNLEAPTMARQGRGSWNGTLTSQVGPPPVATPVEAKPVQSLPPQPPTPSVQLTVLIPRDHPPGQDVPCTIKATNTSGGDAHKVVVRIAELEGAEIASAEPEFKGQASWSFKILKPNESQKIELKLRPKKDAPSVAVKAFVSFEHGQAVKTILSEPKLQIKTELPKTHPADDPIPVRVTIHNNGRVAIAGAKLTQTISEGFEFHKDISGGEATKQKTQRVWPIGTVQPGETKTLQYLVTATRGRNLQVMSVLAADGKMESDNAESRILDSGLKVNLTYDGKVASDQPVQYEATVTNTGTMPLTSVRVTGSIPDECRLTKMTRGGKESQGQVYWTIPKLAPGDSQSFRWSLQTANGGRKQIRAAAIAGRGVEDVAKTETVFPGTAVLHWKQTFDRDTVAFEQQGVFTVRVENTGTEAATNVRLSVELPKSLVSLVQVSPANKKDGDKIVFDPRTVAAGKAETYTITFKGEQFGRAYFNAKLSADALGDRPLGAEKYVEVVRK